MLSEKQGYNQNTSHQITNKAINEEHLKLYSNVYHMFDL